MFNQRLDLDKDDVTVAHTGSYTLLLEGQIEEPDARSYVFQVMPTGNDPPEPFSGEALTLGAVTSGTIAGVGEVDDYTFTLVDRASLYFDSQTGSSDFTEIQAALDAAAAARHMRSVHAQPKRL